MKPCPPVLVGLAALLLAGQAGANQFRVDDQATDAASASLFGPENNEELLAERDDLQQQLALKNREFLAQHKRADMLDVQVHTLQAQLMALQQKVAAVQSVFQANLAGLKLPAFTTAVPALARSKVKHSPGVAHHKVQLKAKRPAPHRAGHPLAQHHPKPRVEQPVEQPVELPVEQPAVLTAASSPPQPVARRAPQEAERRPAARRAAPAARETKAVAQAEPTMASIESDLASDNLSESVAAAELDSPLAPEVKDAATTHPPAAPVAPVATVSVAAEADKVPEAAAAPEVPEVAAAPAAPVAAPVVAETPREAEAPLKEEDTFSDMEAELKAEDAKIDSLDTTHEATAAVAPTDGAAQMVETQPAVEAHAKPAVPAAPAAPAAPVHKATPKRATPMKASPVQQPASDNAKDDSMGEYENDAALLEKLMNGNS